MDEKYKKNFIKAGALAHQVRIFGASLIKPGASYHDVIAKINQKITELGAQPAVPPQIALNNVAAHFLAQPDADIVFKDQVVKLDVGISYQGAIGDCAKTIDLSGKWQHLIDAAESALREALLNIKVGMPFGEIGKIIEDTIMSYGFSPIRNLSGHGLGCYQIHAPPVIPNFYEKTRSAVKPGMTFAIEPFATNGKGMIREQGEATIFAFVQKRPMQSAISQVLLEKMKGAHGLPFAMHQFLGQDFSLAEVKKGLHELQQAGVIIGYPPLVEEAGCMVAQAENSVLVDQDGKVHITTS